MIDRIWRLVIILFTATSGFLIMTWLFPYLLPYIESEIWRIGWLGVPLSTVIAAVIGTIVGGICGYLMAPVIIKRLWVFTFWLESQVNTMVTADILVGALGMMVGLILANLFGWAFMHLPFSGNYIPGVLSVVLAYIGLNVGIKKAR